MDGAFHESDDRLELYALNRMSGSEIDRVEEHLLLCDSCRVRLDEVGAFALSMREALKSQPATQAVSSWSAPGQFRWLEWLKPRFAMAGAFAAVLLAVGIYWTTQGTRGATLPVASLQLTAMRGSEIQSVPASRELDLAFHDGGGAVRADIVDATGAAVWTGPLSQPGSGGTEARIRKTLPPGGYFVRVYSPAGQLLHEYAFRIQR